MKNNGFEYQNTAKAFVHQADTIRFFLIVGCPEGMPVFISFRKESQYGSNKKIFLVAIICFIFFIPQHVFSQVEKEEKIYRLEKIIVRDHPLKNKYMVVTPDVMVINVDKFQKAGPVQNIRDLLSEALDEAATRQKKSNLEKNQN